MPNKSRHSHRRKPVKSSQKPIATAAVSVGQKEAVASSVINATPSKAAHTIAGKYPFVSTELKYTGILALMIFVIIIMLSYIL